LTLPQGVSNATTAEWVTARPRRRRSGRDPRRPAAGPLLLSRSECSLYHGL